MRTMRRAERKMAESNAVDILKNGEYGVLATCGEDRQPYGVPVSYTFADTAIYVHCATSGHKLDNIQENDKVSFTIVSGTEVIPGEFTTRYKSVIVFGRASMVENKEKENALMELVKKYSPNFITQGEEYINKAKDKTKIIKITIEGYSGKERL